MQTRGKGTVQMRVITRAKVKELLGISDSTYDAKIDAKIPLIDAKVKRITGNRFNLQILFNSNASDTIIEVFSVYNSYGVQLYNRNVSGVMNPYMVDDIYEFLEIGQLIEGENIPTDAYITEVYYNGGSVEISGVTYSTPAVVLSSAATGAKTGAQGFIGINNAYQDIIAKGVMYLINQETTSITDNTWIRRSMGPVSIAKTATDNKIDNMSGMPLWFVKALPSYMGGH
jgi:hypothetical protein